MSLCMFDLTKRYTNQGDSRGKGWHHMIYPAPLWIQIFLTISFFSRQKKFEVSNFLLISLMRIFWKLDSKYQKNKLIFSFHNILMPKCHYIFDPEEVHTLIKGLDFHIAPDGPVEARMMLD